MNADAVSIDILDLSLRYPDSAQRTIEDLKMELPANSWTVLLGRSGSGKSTLFRYLTGLLDQVDANGTVRSSDDLPLQGRIAYMAQQDLLLPWLNAIENVCLAERFSTTKTDATEIHQRGMALLEQVGLAEQAEMKPAKLSGGMRQRVALARTLMQDKPIVLMDEPFSALDAVTRHKLQALAVELLKDKTVVLITHDPQEAVRLANQLYVLQGTPSHCERLDVPATAPPRMLDAQCAALQQEIFDLLEIDDA